VIACFYYETNFKQTSKWKPGFAASINHGHMVIGSDLSIGKAKPNIQ